MREPVMTANARIRAAGEAPVPTGWAPGRPPAPRAPHAMRSSTAIVVAACVTLAVLLLFGGCREAWADGAPAGVPQSASGTCYIESTFRVGSQSYFTIISFSGTLSGGVVSSTFECIDYTAGAPEKVNAAYAAALVSYSVRDGWVEYEVTVTPPGATDGVTTDAEGRLTGYQRMRGKVRIPWEFNGSIKLEKRSTNTSLSKGNGCYSLKGAKYGVFKKKADAQSRDAGEAEKTFKTDEDGTWESGDDFAPGTYYVSEMTPPAGFALDASVYKVAVEAGESTLVNADVGYVGDTPKSNPVSLWAVKRDAETADGGPQGNGMLAGTRFEIAYYDGYYEKGTLPASPTRTWVVACGEDGKAYARDDLKVSGDDFYRTESGEITIPLGTVAVRELSPPPGYSPGESEDGTVVTQIKSGDEGKTVKVYVATTFSNQVIRGGVTVGKRDRQNGQYEPQGAAKLDKATFCIVSDNDKPVIVDGTSYARGAVVKTVESAKSGDAYVARTDAECLPYGSYTIYEAAGSEGYLFDDASRSWRQSFTISARGQMIDLTSSAQAATNQVIRGDFSFSKIDGQSGKRLGNTAFLVTSETTGEKHILVTDENGMASTASGWNAHTSNANANDAALDAHGKLDEGKLDDKAGIWFSGSTKVPCAVNDALGALPYDVYRIEELRSSSNEGLELVSFSVRISRNGRDLNLGTVDDNPGPEIGTKLVDPNGSKLVAPAEKATVVDEVTYTNLKRGETYTLVGELHAVDGDGADGGVLSESSVVFKAASANGMVEVTFSLDTTSLIGKGVVAIERLENDRGAVVADHVDFQDEGQTVRVSGITTELLDSVNRGHETPSCGDVTLIDSVTYRGLAPGAAYKIVGELHVRGENGEDEGVALDAGGRAITASQSFVAEDADGTVEVPFTFSAPNQAGKTLVAFEELTWKNVTYSTDANIDDDNQAAWMPSIGTTLADECDGDREASSQGSVTLVDTVTYKGVTPGETYTVRGKLHVKAGGADGGPAVDSQGNPITAETAFVPEKTEGSAKVTFTFSAPGLAGKDAVAFEELIRGDRTYAVHADIEDDAQTVHFSQPPLAEEEAGDSEELVRKSPEKPENPTESDRPAPKDSSTPQKSPTPRTGDSLDVVPFAAIASISLGAVALSLYLIRARRSREIRIQRGAASLQPSRSRPRWR